MTTAILFFSRTPAAEARRKTLAPQRNEAVVETLIQHTVSRAEKTGLPVYHCFTTDQAGATFGERLANAMEAVYAQGHEALIVIGNDSPGLTTSDLLLAAQTLRNGQLVLGPARDGGVYLIGMTTAAYRREAFINLAWETPQLQAAFRNYLRTAQVAARFLIPRIDIDSATDLQRFLNCLSPGNSLKKQLERIMLTPYRALIFPPVTPQPTQGVLACPFLRGPPVSFC